MQRTIAGSCKLWRKFGRYGNVNMGIERLLAPSGTAAPPLRNYMSRTSANFEKQLKERDMIPEDFCLVYRGGMDNYMLIAHSGSALLVLFGMVSLQGLFEFDKPITFPIETSLTSLIGIQNYTQLAIMYGSFFAMVYCLRVLSVRYVLRMYYNKKTDTFRAVRHGILPFVTRTQDFQAGTLKRIEKKYIVPWWNAQYDCNGQNLLILEHGFRTNADCEKMFVR